MCIRKIQNIKPLKPVESNAVFIVMGNYNTNQLKYEHKVKRYIKLFVLRLKLKLTETLGIFSSITDAIISKLIISISKYSPSGARASCVYIRQSTLACVIIYTYITY